MATNLSLCETLLFDITERGLRTGVIYPCYCEREIADCAHLLQQGRGAARTSTSNITAKEFKEAQQIYHKWYTKGVTIETLNHKKVLQKLKIVSISDLITLASRAPFDFMRLGALLQINMNLAAFDTRQSDQHDNMNSKCLKYVHKLIKKGIADVLAEGFRAASLEPNIYDETFYGQITQSGGGAAGMISEKMRLTPEHALKNSQMWMAALSSQILERILTLDDSVVASFAQRLVSEGVLDLFLACVRNPKCTEALDIILVPFYQLGMAHQNYNTTTDFLKAGAVDALCEVLDQMSPITQQRHWAIVHQAVIGLSYCPINDAEKKKLFDHPKAIDTLLSTFLNPEANQVTHFRIMARLYAALGNHSYTAVSDWTKISIFADHLLDVLFGSGLLGLGGTLLSDPITDSHGKLSKGNVSKHHLWRCGFDNKNFVLATNCPTGGPLALWDVQYGSEKTMTEGAIPELVYNALFALTQVTYAHQESFAKVKGYYFDPVQAAKREQQVSQVCAFCGVQDHKKMETGRLVLIQNLKTTQHNGKTGVLKEYDAKKERWCVSVVEDPGNKRKNFMLKKVNLKILKDNGLLGQEMDASDPTLSTCTGCHFARYCCAAHQKADWKRHKRDCKGIQKMAKRSARCQKAGKCFVLCELQTTWMSRITQIPGLGGMVPIVERGIMMLEGTGAQLQPAHRVTTVTRSRQYACKRDYMSNSKSSALLTVSGEPWESGQATPKVAVVCSRDPSDATSFNSGVVTVTCTANAHHRPLGYVQTSNLLAEVSDYQVHDIGLFSGTTEGYVMYLPIHVDTTILQNCNDAQHQGRNSTLKLGEKERKDRFEAMIPVHGKIAYAGHSRLSSKKNKKKNKEKNKEKDENASVASVVVAYLESFPRTHLDHPLCMCSAVMQGQELHVWTYTASTYASTHPHIHTPPEKNMVQELMRTTGVFKTRNNQPIDVVKRARRPVLTALQATARLVLGATRMQRFYRVVVAAGTQVFVVDIDPVDGSAEVVFDVDVGVSTGKIVSIDTMQEGKRFAVLHESGVCWM